MNLMQILERIEKKLDKESGSNKSGRKVDPINQEGKWIQ
jgi:hypothetical protein